MRDCRIGSSAITRAAGVLAESPSVSIALAKQWVAEMGSAQCPLVPGARAWRLLDESGARLCGCEGW